MARIHDNIVYGPEEELIPAHLSFGQFLFDTLRRGGDKTAMICGLTGTSMTYLELLQSSVNLAASLQRLGLQKGDVVSLSSENRFEFTITSLAVMYCGATLSTLNILYTPGEVTHILNITKSKYIVTSQISAQNIYESCKNLPFVQKFIIFGDEEIITAVKYNDLVNQYNNIEDFVLADVKGAEDTLAVMCSSGTTGMPKGVMLTHVNFLLLCAHFRYYLATSRAQKGHTVRSALCILPWFHAYGFITTWAILALQVEMVYLVRFEGQQFLETIQKYRINMTTIVPPLAVFLAKHPLVLEYDLSSINELWCGAAPLSSDIEKAIAQRTSISGIKQGYGLTEVTMACCVHVSAMPKEGSCGPPAPGMRIKVLDTNTGKKVGVGQEGELWIKSPLRMKGYMGDPAASDQLIDRDGYVRTGDVGYYDQEGSFYIVDRLKELIKYKGFQVAPAELEALLLQHPDVADCGVIGVPDESAGELPLAFVVTQPGARVTQHHLVTFIANKVSSAKHLRGGVIFVESIPKNASGKILRRELREMLKQTKKSKL